MFFRRRSTKSDASKRTPLPPGRFRMGGAHFKNDNEFIRTAVRDVHRLEEQAGLTRESSLLDWGCGAGRLAIGIREHLGRIRDYHGVDIQPEVLGWAVTNLTAPGFRFTLLNVANERYNPDGSMERTLAAEPGSVDVLYAYSVFSHMNDVDTPAYLGLIAQALSFCGRAFITCFVEDDVPAWEENPAGYGPLDWRGRLHCTRFNRDHFESHIRAAGLDVELFEHGGETDGQSLYILRKSGTQDRESGAAAPGIHRRRLGS